MYGNAFPAQQWAGLYFMHNLIPVGDSQSLIISMAKKMFTDRGWFVLAETFTNFSVEKKGEVFSCFLYPSDRVVAMRESVGAQTLSEAITEPWCLVLTLESGRVTGKPIYVPVPRLDALPSGLEEKLGLQG